MSLIPYNKLIKTSPINPPPIGTHKLIMVCEQDISNINKAFHTPQLAPSSMRLLSFLSENKLIVLQIILTCDFSTAAYFELSESLYCARAISFRNMYVPS